MGHSVKQRLKMAEHAGDRLRLKRADIIGELETEFRPGPGDDRHRIVRVHPVADVSDLEDNPAVTEGWVDRRILEDKQALKQRLAAPHLAPLLDLDQRGIVVPAQPDVLGQYLLEPWHEAAVGRYF